MPQQALTRMFSREGEGLLGQLMLLLPPVSCIDCSRVGAALSLLSLSPFIPMPQQALQQAMILPMCTYKIAVRCKGRVL